MGFWSAAINGNDVAEDLKDEYSILFGKYDAQTTVKKLDEYVKANFDEGDYKNYVYSVALYMYKHGILTDEIKERALSLIKSDDFKEYANVGKTFLRERERVLKKLKETLSSPQPPKKKITLSINPDRFLNVGDIVSIRLNCCNKFVLLQKIYDHVGTGSAIEKDVKDISPYFLLLDYFSDKEATLEEASEKSPITYVQVKYGYRLQDKKIIAQPHNIVRNFVFFCDGKAHQFKKRGYKILGNIKPKIDYKPSVAEMEICNLWREEDELRIVEAIEGNYVSDVKTKRNIDALMWLYDHKDEQLLRAYEEYERNNEVEVKGLGRTFAILTGLIQNGYKNEDWK